MSLGTATATHSPEIPSTCRKGRLEARRLFDRFEKNHPELHRKLLDGTPASHVFGAPLSNSQLQDIERMIRFGERREAVLERLKKVLPVSGRITYTLLQTKHADLLRDIETYVGGIGLACRLAGVDKRNVPPKRYRTLLQDYSFVLEQNIRVADLKSWRIFQERKKGDEEAELWLVVRAVQRKRGDWKMALLSMGFSESALGVYKSRNDNPAWSAKRRADESQRLRSEALEAYRREGRASEEVLSRHPELLGLLFFEHRPLLQEAALAIQTCAKKNVSLPELEVMVFRIFAELLMHQPAGQELKPYLRETLSKRITQEMTRQDAQRLDSAVVLQSIRYLIEQSLLGLEVEALGWNPAGEEARLRVKAIEQLGGSWRMGLHLLGISCINPIAFRESKKFENLKAKCWNEYLKTSRATPELLERHPELLGQLFFHVLMPKRNPLMNELIAQAEKNAHESGLFCLPPEQLKLLAFRLFADALPRQTVMHDLETFVKGEIRTGLSQANMAYTREKMAVHRNGEDRRNTKDKNSPSSMDLMAEGLQ